MMRDRLLPGYALLGEIAAQVQRHVMTPSLGPERSCPGDDSVLISLAEAVWLPCLDVRPA